MGAYVVLHTVWVLKVFMCRLTFLALQNSLAGGRDWWREQDRQHSQDLPAGWRDSTGCFWVCLMWSFVFSLTGRAWEGWCIPVEHWSIFSAIIFRGTANNSVFSYISQYAMISSYQALNSTPFANIARKAWCHFRWCLKWTENKTEEACPSLQYFMSWSRIWIKNGHVLC